MGAALGASSGSNDPDPDPDPDADGSGDALEVGSGWEPGAPFVDVVGSAEVGAGPAVAAGSDVGAGCGEDEGESGAGAPAGLAVFCGADGAGTPGMPASNLSPAGADGGVTDTADRPSRFGGEIFAGPPSTAVPRSTSGSSSPPPFGGAAAA